MWVILTKHQLMLVAVPAEEINQVSVLSRIDGITLAFRNAPEAKEFAEKNLNCWYKVVSV